MLWAEFRIILWFTPQPLKSQAPVCIEAAHKFGWPVISWCFQRWSEILILNNALHLCFDMCTHFCAFEKPSFVHLPQTQELVVGKGKAKMWEQETFGTFWRLLVLQVWQNLPGCRMSAWSLLALQLQQAVLRSGFQSRRWAEVEWNSGSGEPCQQWQHSDLHLVRVSEIAAPVVSQTPDS